MTVSITSDGVLVIYTETPLEKFAVTQIAPKLLIMDGNLPRNMPPITYTLVPDSGKEV